MHLRSNLMLAAATGKFFSALLFPAVAHGFAWGPSQRSQVALGNEHSEQMVRPTTYETSQNRLPFKYALTLSELQELESEPLCHRIAARLLVNNCQLLDGQNDATVLTDTGRAARDFVDSYAASLAICDLERGSFSIPSSCSKFRELALAKLPTPSKPHLHVSTAEIDDCLEGLAQTDSTWNTWVSYRHKALRFCEAARADSEKDQTIHLYEKLTSILAKLTEDVEVEIEQRMRSMEQRLKHAASDVDDLGPRVTDVSNGLSDIQDFMDNRLFSRLQDSAGIIQGNLDSAQLLQKVLAALLQKTSEQESELASARDLVLHDTSEKMRVEFDSIVTSMAALTSSSSFLQRHMEEFQQRAAEAERRQHKMETGLKRLEDLASDLSLQHEVHQEHLSNARTTAEEVLGTLDLVSSSVSSVHRSMSSPSGLSTYWPYVFCPALSLVMGSYGLPPSVSRNIWLISLGELAGFAVSAAQRHSPIDWLTPATNNTSKPQNATYSMDISTYLPSEFISKDYDIKYSGVAHSV